LKAHGAEEADWREEFDVMTIPSRAFEYYLQGFRLNSQMTKKGNAQAQEMFRLATKEAPNFARAHGHLAYTRLLAWLNGWIPSSNPPADLRTLAEKAVKLDGEDYDNLWSKAGVSIYTAKYQKDANAAFKQGFELFGRAIAAAPNKAIDFNIDGLHVDLADAKFFAGANGLADIEEAIETTQAAIKKVNEDHPRRFLWSLGWAYYERAYFTKDREDYVKSLDALLQISNPTDTIIKNIIASKVALDWTVPARRLARDFRCRNPKYTLAIEERWPYRDPKRLQRWQSHLGSASLAGK
jgi:hypothetical protein